MNLCRTFVVSTRLLSHQVHDEIKKWFFFSLFLSFPLLYFLQTEHWVPLTIKKKSLFFYYVTKILSSKITISYMLQFVIQRLNIRIFTIFTLAAKTCQTGVKLSNHLSTPLSKFSAKNKCSNKLMLQHVF